MSLKRYLLEETHETIEAIDTSDPMHIKEELGDLLYLIVLLAQIHDEGKVFDIGGVVDAITEKMIRRHPHVFGDEKIVSRDDLREKWLAIKKDEK